MHRVILIARHEVSSAAAEWAAAGLIGHALWIDADTLELDFSNPTSVTARLVGPGLEPTERALAAELADIRDLTEVRVVWVRDSVHHADDTTMAALKTWIRQRVPQKGCIVRYFDLVVPVDAADRVVPEAPHEWQQFRVTPEDRPAPGLADAGFPGGERRIAVAVHATVALAGILGGAAAHVDGLGQADQHPVWNMHAFSRLVGGGGRLAQAAAHFRDEVLPTWSAANLDDPRFVGANAEEARELVESLSDWWCGEGEDTLAYRSPPSARMAPAETLTLEQHLKNVAAFAGWALRSLFRFTPADARRWTTNHPLDTEDQGYRIEHDTRIEESDLPDWAAQDAALRARIHTSLAEAEDRAGVDATPPERVWAALAEAASGVVDGGGLPHGCPTLLSRGQVVVVPPECVVPAGPRGPAVTALPPSGRCAAPLLSKEVADDALRRSRAAVFEGNAPLVVDPNKVSRTAERLCADLATADRVERERQAGELAMEPDAPAGPRTQAENAETAEQPELTPAQAVGKPPLVTPSLLDRIRSRVLGDRITARLDAERWSWMATAPYGSGPGRLAITGWDADAPSEALRDDERRFRRRVGVATGLALTLLAVWTWLREPILAFLGSTFGWAVPVWAGYALAAAVGVIGAALAAVRLYRAYAAFLERGRRLLESRRALETRARAAWTAYNRLTNVDAILGRWCRVLGGVLETRQSPEMAAGPAFPALPAALRFGEPVMAEQELTRAMGKQGATPGWRFRELATLAEAANSVADMTELVGDKGLVSGALDRLVRELEGGAPQAESRRRYLEGLSARAGATLTGRSVRVSRISDPAGWDELSAGAFVGEVIEDGGSYRAGEDVRDPSGPGRTLHLVFASVTGGESIEVTPTERLTRVAVRVAMTPHARVPEGTVAGAAQ